MSYNIWLLILLLVIIIFFYLSFYVKYEKFTNIKNCYDSLLDNIYCVNLDKSKDRWKYIKNIGDKIGINIKRFSAINGKKLNNIKQYCTDKYYNIMKNQKNIYGNVGCYLSHLNLWKKIYNNMISHAIIIEDDIILKDTFKKELYDTLKKIPDNWDIIYLGITRPCGKKINNNIYIHKHPQCNKDNGGTFGYIVNRKSLYKLIRFADCKINKMIDHKMRDLFHKLNIYIIYPLLINHNYNLQSDRKLNNQYDTNYINKANDIKIII
jgi:glycosyl transferase, family 25